MPETRKRTCESLSLLKTGIPCFGPDTESRLCTGKHMQLQYHLNKIKKCTIIGKENCGFLFHLDLALFCCFYAVVCLMELVSK